MDTKKWPVVAQILIGLGCIGGLRGIISGVGTQNFVDILFGIAILVVFWGVYKFNLWALKAVTILYSLNLIFMIFGIVGGMPLFLGIIAIIFNGLLIYYFNTKAVKDLFVTQLS